jgi:alpha-mannosidase
VTVETFASVHQPDFGVTLYCPDAPLVQIGNLNWAKKQDDIPRQQNPLLVAWPLNNYWETNFRASQPGMVEFRYSLVSHGKFDPARAMVEGQQTCNPPVTHLVLDNATPRQGSLLAIEGEKVVVTYIKTAENKQGVIVRLVNVGDTTAKAKLTLPGHTVGKAWVCSTLEENRTRLPLSGDAAICELPPRHITTVRLVRK